MKKAMAAFMVAILCVLGAGCVTVDLHVHYPHLHEYDGVWEVTATEHQRKCIECSELNEMSKGAHVWNDENECTVCGYEGKTTAVEHDYTNGEWIKTETEHKKQCADCEEIEENSLGAHTWDTTHACTVCSYEGVHDYAAEWTENTTDKTHDYSCECGAVNAIPCDCNAWDGVIGELPEIVGDEMIIKDAGELAAFANSVNQGNNYAGKTIKLAADINLDNQLWVPIAARSGQAFYGNFDGQNHIISNLKVLVTNEGGATEGGLFGWINGSTIKNVKIEGVDARGEKRVGGVVGYIETTAGAVTIENCHVKDAVLVGDRVGGITGYVNESVTIKDCSVTNATITAVQSQGKIVGWDMNVTSVNNEVTNVTMVNTLEKTFVIEGE